MHDSGIVSFYHADNEAARGGAPSRTLTLKRQAYFENRTVGMSRFFAGRQANVSVDRVIRTWRSGTVNTQDVAVIDGEQYTVQQVQQVRDDDEQPVTDYTLERLVDRYEIEGGE